MFFSSLDSLPIQRTMFETVTPNKFVNISVKLPFSAYFWPIKKDETVASAQPQSMRYWIKIKMPLWIEFRIYSKLLRDAWGRTRPMAPEKRQSIPSSERKTDLLDACLRLCRHLYYSCFVSSETWAKNSIRKNRFYFNSKFWTITRHCNDSTQRFRCEHVYVVRIK